MISKEKEMSQCEICGNSFYIKPSRLARTKTHTCSMACKKKMCVVRTLGDKNPNSKYHIDPLFFDTVDTEFKAWLLGWIASDGHIKSGKENSICLQIHMKDIDVLESICRYFALPSGFIKRYPKKNQAKISFCMASWKTAICALLGIDGGKKSHTLRYPDSLPAELDVHFIRGYFEGDGHVASLPATAKRGYARVSIVSNSPSMIESLKARSNNMLRSHKESVEANGGKAIDFLGWIYANATYKMERKYNAYRDIATFNRGKYGKFIWQKADENAVPPSKKRASDSGYDLTVISVVSVNGNYTLYDTGIRVVPPTGVYFDVVPRSSLWDSGYIMSNSVGVIDCSYTGTIKVGLLKVNMEAPDLKLPAKIVQMIPRPLAHFESLEGDVLNIDTNRGEGGFGSTDGRKL
jgi:deoxyuridine 5'-triphosphate nucleotidohydrolase